MERKIEGFKKPINAEKNDENRHQRRRKPGQDKHQNYDCPGQQARQHLKKAVHSASKYIRGRGKRKLDKNLNLSILKKDWNFSRPFYFPQFW